MENFKRDFHKSFEAHRQKGHPRGVKFWLNVATLLLIVVIVVAARKDIAAAFREMGRANWLVLLLIIPVQLASYYAGTEIFLTYLRARGKLRNVSNIEATSMSLELNFVNHVFPSGGMSGIGYMSWRLSKLGVSAGQSTMAQIMKYVVQMATFMVLMVLALIWATVTNQTANWVAVATTIAITALVFIVVFGSYLVGSRERMTSFAHFFARNVNRLVSFLTRGRKERALDSAKTEKFFLDFHEDFLVLRDEKSLLIKPIIWSFVFTIFDVGLFIVAFASLGVFINPAILFIAYGAATLSGMFMITPGGAGAYEAIMISILTASSVAPGVAFAGVILARVILILLTLVTGFFAYQRTLRLYGQPDKKPRKRSGSEVLRESKTELKLNAIAHETPRTRGDLTYRASDAPKIVPKNVSESKSLSKKPGAPAKNPTSKTKDDEMAKYFDDITIDGEKW